MDTPKFEVIPANKNGKKAFELIVRNAMYSADLDALTASLGYIATPDIPNRRAIICTTPAEMDAARAPLLKFFDAKGKWYVKQWSKNDGK